MTSKFDSILEHLGTGKWNFIGIVLLSYWALQIPSMSLSGTYLTPAMEHSCRIPPDGTPIYIEGDDNETTIDACWYHRDTRDGVEKLPCTEWDFDNSTFVSTLTSEFQLVCDREYLRPTYQSMYFFGALIGSGIVGFMSDRYGRKSASAVGIITYTIMSNCINWLPNMPSILAVRFIQGLMHPTSMSVSYTLALEKCETKNRSIVGITATFPWLLGYLMWAGFGYLIREWRWLTFAVPLPMFLVLPILWFTDESPRWLVLKGHHDRALRVLHRAARWNKTTLPPDDELRTLMKEIQFESTKENKQIKEGTSKILMMMKFIRDEIFILFRTRKLRRITLSIYCIFLVSGTVYYGLSLSGGNLGSDPFMYMALSGLMEIPSYTVTLPMVNHLGRRLSNIICYLITGVSLLLLTLVPKGWMSTTFALIGKMGISSAYHIAYLHATELFPTQVRVRGIGTSGMVSKTGSICVAYMVDALGALYWWAPSVVCGGAAIVACLVCFLLPETLGKPLPDTVADLERESVSTKRELPEMRKEKDLSQIDNEENIPLSA